jgi:hypothetical protein
MDYRILSVLVVLVASPAALWACGVTFPYPSLNETQLRADIVLTGDVTKIESALEIDPYIQRYHVTVDVYAKGNAGKQITVYDHPVVPCINGKPIISIGRWTLHLRTTDGRHMVIYAGPP